jgi:hypothetical protein
VALDAASLTNAIDSAFATEWSKAKPAVPLPDAGAADRRLLFAAVARGLLQYLSDHESSVVSELTLKTEGSDPVRYTVTDADLAIAVD